jgi:acetoin utilization protein AcuC
LECRLGIAFGKELESYSFPDPHPFNSERVKAFYRSLEMLKIKFTKVSPEMADKETIGFFHDSSHIDFVKKMSESGFGYLDAGDTPAYKGVFEASSYVVGTTVKCCNLIVNRELDHCFNPVGGLHHAGKNRSAGFCVFNDVAVAIEYLRKLGFVRFLYVDIDDHHGDGVFYSYESDPYVFIFDVHEDGRFQYPGTGFEHERGKGVAEGTKINIPLPPGSGDEKINEIVEKLDEFARRAEPDFIILQAGADSISGDALGNLKFTPLYHSAVAARLHQMSHILCKGRFLALGGGGYKVENCVKAWIQVCRSMLEL